MKKKATRVKRAKKVSPYNKEFAMFWGKLSLVDKQLIEILFEFPDIYFPPDKPHVVKINGYSYGL